MLWKEKNLASVAIAHQIVTEVLRHQFFPPFVYVLKGVLHTWTSKCQKFSSFNNNVFENSRTRYCLTKTVRKVPYLHFNIFKKARKLDETVFSGVNIHTQAEG